jgi:hypothetical protein
MAIVRKLKFQLIFLEVQSKLNEQKKLLEDMITIKNIDLPYELELLVDDIENLSLVNDN